ncbi:MAG TPA: hypothetical protein VE078_16995, partial [Thermoanaerobaculia bacterium]|nr:hypothetical protein [Thermoanaerobaculia bacterium]
VLMVIVALIVFLAVGPRPFPPTVLSKINTFAQLTAVLVVLLSARLQNLEPIAMTLLYVVVVLTLSSGLDYVYRLSRPAAPAE